MTRLVLLFYCKNENVQNWYWYFIVVKKSAMPNPVVCPKFWISWISTQYISGLGYMNLRVCSIVPDIYFMDFTDRGGKIKYVRSNNVPSLFSSFFHHECEYSELFGILPLVFDFVVGNHMGFIFSWIFSWDLFRFFRASGN